MICVPVEQLLQAYWCSSGHRVMSHSSVFHRPVCRLELISLVMSLTEVSGSATHSSGSGCCVPLAGGPYRRLLRRRRQCQVRVSHGIFHDNAVVECNPVPELAITSWRAGEPAGSYSMGHGLFLESAQRSYRALRPGMYLGALSFTFRSTTHKVARQHALPSATSCLLLTIHDVRSTDCVNFIVLTAHFDLTSRELFPSD